VFTIPQLDPYGACRNEKLSNPCVDFEGPLPQSEKPSLFLALPSTFPNLSRIARAIERTGAKICAYMPGPPSVGLTLMNTIGVRIVDIRPRLSEVFSGASVVLAGSADLALSAYLAGRPQIVFKDDLETTLMASELEKRHAAIALDVSDAEKTTAAIRELMNNPSYARSAQEEARRVRAMLTSNNSASLAAKECLKLMQSESSPLAG
jgi:UDP:flavonoid glycosyltransferase YjiC (YdhE family)